MKTTGKVEKNNKEFGKTVEGFLKLGYDNDKLAGFVNYDLGKKTTVVNGSYKYTQDKLTLKPYTELEMEILTPTRIKFGNITEYKFNNDFKVKNDTAYFNEFAGSGKGSFGIKTDTKVEYTPENIKQLKADFKARYDYVDSKTPNKIAKSHIFEIESNTSYDFDLTNGFKLTPAMRMTYHGNFSNVDEKQIMGQRVGTVDVNALVLDPSATLTHKYNNLTTSLKLESVISFASQKINLINTMNMFVKKMENKINTHNPFAFQDVSLGATLSIKYSWK